MVVKTLRDERIGAIGRNKLGSTMEVVEYAGERNVWVKFERGNPIHTRWEYFAKGEVRSPYDKSAHGIGYMGEGKYKSVINGVKTKQHNVWAAMLKRCYYENYQENNRRYKDCNVCEEWHNFQNFGKWFDENYYEIDGEKMHLDKDILVKGNKIYSPETCVFVPQRINALFAKNNAKRGDLPIGVIWNKRDKNYIAQCGDGEIKSRKIGSYDTPILAFQAYKTFKENYIKDVAEKYKGKIPTNVYKAMINYIVEITD